MSQLYYIYKSFLIALSIFLVGCAKDNASKDGDRGSLSPNQLRIAVQIPTTATPKRAMPKSGQIFAESRMTEIQVLVFENGLYAYKANGEGISQSDNTATFNVRVRSTSVPTTLFIVANNNNVVNASEPPVGTPIEEVRTRFNTSYTPVGITGDMPMWGSYTFNAGIASTPVDILTPISLLRAVARADVHVAPTASNFTLETVQVFRAANSIQLIPNSPNTELLVTNPSIPAGTLFNINTNPIAATSATLSEGQIYLPESTAPTAANQVSQATCVVVGGRFNNSAATRYYRLDFNPQVSNHPLGQILRNGRYDFTISEVVADGYDTPSEAAQNPSSNMNFDLVIWPGEQIEYMFFDNFDYFGLSALDVGLGGTINYTKQIDISTNLSGYALRFGTDGPWEQTLNNGVFSVTRTNGDQTLVVTALTNNFTPSYRKQLVQVLSGNFEPITLTIIQASTPILLEWAPRNVDALRTFAPAINSYGRLYQWNRTNSFTAASGGTNPPAGWNSALSTSLTWTVGNNPCPDGWRMPTSDEWILFRVRYPFASPRVATPPNDGFWFGATQQEADDATFTNPGNAIFIPGTGRRTDAGTYQGSTHDFAYYWSSNRTSTSFLHFYLRRQELTSFGTGTSANTVRCLRDL